MKRLPLSVIMSVYNGQPFLHQAIESILHQTYSDFEFLISNDGSTDNTPEILKKYASKDSRIFVIQQENVGLTVSLNRMIARAKGKFIARMDADDVSLPARFAKQLKKLEAHPECLVVGCWVQKMNEHAVPTHEIIFPDNPALLRRYLYKGTNCFTHGSVMIKKSVFEEMGFFYRFKYRQDFDLWLRLSENGVLGMVEEVLYQRREHSNTISRSFFPRRAALNNLILTLAEERKVYDKEVSKWQEQEQRIFNKIPLWTEREGYAYNTFVEAYKLLCAGENTKARRLLLSVKDELKSSERWAVPYYLSYLPGFLTAPVLRLRNRIKDKWYFCRALKKNSDLLI